MLGWFRTLFHSVPSPGLKKIRNDFLAMLETARQEFATACLVALDGEEAESLRENLLALDKTVNKSERQIRKELVVHCSVQGTVDPESLVMMSIAKDAERLGDYSKNIFDMGTICPFLPEGDDRVRLLVLRASIDKVFVDAISACDRQDEDFARQIISECVWLAKQCDRNTERLLRLDTPDCHTAADVLMFRFMKRMTSHLKNICSSVVQPVHKLDFTSKITKGMDTKSGDLLDRREMLGEGEFEAKEA
ncbi:MAG: PhoU domain-containing protein [Planctomycetia bacterium]|nr:PhoU domain-containing protein [Planctomycetia bacterium]